MADALPMIAMPQYLCIIKIKIIMKTKSLLLLGLSSILWVSCVSTKKYKQKDSELAAMQKKYAGLDSAYRALAEQNKGCRDSLALGSATVLMLNDRLKEQKMSNDQVFNQLKDLSVISSSQAESIKKSLDNIGVKDQYINKLQSAINRKDSLNMALVLNLKGAIGNLDDKDVNIKVEKGVVYIDISDKMLFKTGKYEVSDRAREVLGKVAKVLQAHPEIEFLVEGHTDSVSFKQGILQDNWDLSVMRATSVVRILQNEYHLDPAHITAAGRSQYVPVGSNDTEEGRAMNRRTRIVILPQLDQFFKLLEKPADK
jgi:chemotaxis protein MotB